jgi:hypothetical protein
MRPTRTAAALSIAALTVVALTACSSSSDSDASKPADTPAASQPADTPAADPASDAPSPAASSTPSTPTTAAADKPATSSGGSGKTASFAQPVTKPGTKLTTIKAKDFSVDVYEVGTTKATTHGQFADPDTNKPIIAKGDKIVFVNYVVTNTSSTPIRLGDSLVELQAKYADWKYLDGMDSVVDDDLFAKEKVDTDELKPGAFNDKGVYLFGAGEQYSVGANFKYEPGESTTFTATLVPKDAKGNLDEDKRETATATAKIK